VRQGLSCNNFQWRRTYWHRTVSHTCAGHATLISCSTRMCDVFFALYRGNW